MYRFCEFSTCSNVFFLDRSVILRGVLLKILVVALHMCTVSTKILDYARDLCKSLTDTLELFLPFCVFCGFYRRLLAHAKLHAQRI